jgi:uncharacterized damage-inducible protein DinB
MNERDVLLDELRRAHDGDPWHGESTRAILAGVTARDAASRPIPSAHTIWEILLHMTAWTREVTLRLREGHGGVPKDGDWPAVGPTSHEAWLEALDQHERAHRDLLQALADAPASRLPERYGVERDKALGTGETFTVMLHGIAQHDAYHSGQISLLKKARRGA